MARTIKDARLDKRSARESLKAQQAPYWRPLHEGLHVGYRKGKRGGKWLLRWYNSSTRRYRMETLGVADDTTDADGVAVLDWKQAQDAARERAEEMAAEATGTHRGPYTVADALDDYHANIEREGRDASDSRMRSCLYITPHLGEIDLANLTAETLRNWLADIATLPGYTKSGKTRKVPEFDTAEAEHAFWRRRKDSANRILTILKAALNHAFTEGKVASNMAWAGKRVKPFRAVSTERVQYLAADEVTRLINAAEPGFRELVQGALYTGARYGDLAAMNVGDFNAEAGMVMSGNSKASKPHPVYLTAEGIEFFRRITRGRERGEAMFPHPEGGRWGKSVHWRPMRRAVEAARIETPITFHGLRHTYASHAVMAGVPLMVVAQNLGHSDTRMVERHYGHLAASWVKEQIQAGMPSWGDPGADDRVTGIRK